MAKLLDNMSITVQFNTFPKWLHGWGTDFWPTDLLGFLQYDKWLACMPYVLVLLLFLFAPPRPIPLCPSFTQLANSSKVPPYQVDTWVQPALLQVLKK